MNVTIANEDPGTVTLLLTSQTVMDRAIIDMLLDRNVGDPSPGKNPDLLVTVGKNPQPEDHIPCSCGDEGCQYDHQHGNTYHLEDTT